MAYIVYTNTIKYQNNEYTRKEFAEYLGISRELLVYYLNKFDDDVESVIEALVKKGKLKRDSVNILSKVLSESPKPKKKRSREAEKMWEWRNENCNKIDPYECFEWNGHAITLEQMARKARCSLKEMYERCNTYKTIEECLGVGV